MIEDTLREALRNRIVKILEVKLGADLAREVEKKLSHEERGRILKEYEKRGKVSEETYNMILSKYCFKDLTSLLFGISSDIQVFPEITQSLIGSGKSGIKGLRKHVRELGYSDDKFEEIMYAIYSEIRKISKDPRYSELLATASLEIGSFFLESDYRKAEEFLLEAYEMRSNLNNQKILKLLDALIKLTVFYKKVKKVEKAKEIYNKIVIMLKEFDGVNIDSEAIDTLRELEKLFDKPLGKNLFGKRL
ncbi:MAG: hypothetical protein N3D09_02325 [Archaeoglobaceae archaeon]|nr:hypothetical protein [Archaeoglobaceae archaeon]